ncbi:MAG: alpha/beta fold hydrolase [Burkholderiales bacterium]|nr:alpha/beta fold hydrolase [Burkholderiales bacterium]
MTTTLSPIATSSDYWHCYHSAEQIAAISRIVRTRNIVSANVRLHIDVYPQSAADAPLLILNHGGGGHAGLLAGAALAFHQQGYVVIVPDQKGQGRSGGQPGDFTISEVVQNIVDVATWARCNFRGTLFMCGGSIGSGLTYAAAAVLAHRGQAPAAIACLNLYDFGDPRTGIAFTRFAWLANLPAVPQGMRAASAALARIAPGMRFPYRPLARFRNMVDERDLAQGFYKKWQADPCTLRSVTASYFASMLDTPFVIPLHRNTKVPVLVINPLRDKMVDPQLTRDCYTRLTGPREYAEICWGHFSLQADFYRELLTLGDRWYKRHASCAPYPASA